ncbi:MAG: hypothetical protein EOP00_03945 [Pedobacter sp.]|nr:MAG: hypothetical protein EOP00_03945 [Pedobacter sp.]
MMKIILKKSSILFFIIILISCKKDVVIVPNIVCWGDSLTNGSGSSNDHDYPNVLSKLTNTTCFNMGVGGETSGQIKLRMLADLTKRDQGFIIIWVGRNNYYNKLEVLNDIREMVSSLKHSRYCVLSVINGDYGAYERLNGEGYQSIISINKDLKNEYGSHYLDVRKFLVNSYRKDDINDLDDMKNDIIPSSLRTDRVHLNDLGYQIVANYIYSTYKDKFGKEF